MTIFNDFVFTGNPHLCGPPLVAQCEGDDPDQGKGQGQSNVEAYLGPVFVIVIKKPCCEAYFRLVSKIVDKVL